MLNERKSEKGRKYKVQRHSVRQERNLAVELNGKVTSGSGNKQDKADVKIPKLARIEAKATEKKSFSVTREMVDKLRKAKQTDEIPFLQIDLLGDPTMRMVCVEYHYLQELLERVNNVN